MSFAGGQPVEKGKEFLLVFPIHDNTGALVSGASGLDSRVSKDGKSFVACVNEAEEIDSRGIYKLTLTADEMDADVLAIITRTTTLDAKTAPTIIYTSSAQISDLVTLGAGAISWTYTLTEEDTGFPIADAGIWCTQDVAGRVVLASGQSDQNGRITFYLDVGTVYIWRAKSGWNFSNPDVEVIS